ncbi:hypothetical protein [Fibrella aquatica]|uniref:hypothetical protein n=1 Tax=Fibrella aquatica TaxID=3242487 RepID=UPI00352060DD
MELTHSYKRQAPFAGLRSLFNQRIEQFVNQNPVVFEALSRTGAPFGGSLRPLQHSAGGNNSTVSRHQLQRIQRQLDMLTKQVAHLSQQAEGIGSKTREAVPEKQIGINRFRALQEK